MLPVVADLPPPAEAALAAFAEQECAAERVDVLAVGVAISTVPEGRAMWSGDPCAAHPSLRLKVIDDGQIVFNASVRPELDIWVTTVVSVTDTDPGAPLSIEPGVVRLRQIVGTPVGQGDWVARVHHKPGDPITDRTATTALDRNAGDAVALVVTRGAVTLTAPGTLLANARVGDDVQVINEATRVRLRGKLVSPDTVEIR